MTRRSNQPPPTQQGGGEQPPSPLLDIPVADDYRPGPGELDNLVYLTLKYTVGWNMRQADKRVILVLLGYPEEPVLGRVGISHLVWVACQYAWDHIASEPEDTSPRKFFDRMSNILQVWYKQCTQQQREETGE